MTASLPELLELLARLHRSETLGYGNAWRKRGELMAIFPNLARKYDRLVVALDEGVTANDERLADTDGHLCVYTGEYLAWSARQQPKAFETSPPNLSAADFEDARGPEALEAVFAALPECERNTRVVPPAAVEDAGRLVKTAFAELETLLDHQEQGGWVPTQEKVAQASAICDASVWLLLRIGERDP